MYASKFFLIDQIHYSHTSYLKIYKRKDIIKICLIRTACFKVSEKMFFSSFALYIIDFFLLFLEYFYPMLQLSIQDFKLPFHITV